MNQSLVRQGRNLALVPALLVAALATPLLAQDEDARLEAFFRQHLETVFKLRPVEASGLGDHRYDNRLDDISRPAREAWTALARQTLKELPRQVSYQKLSRDGQIDFEILRHDLEKDLWLERNTHPFEEDPRTYGGYISDSLYALLTHSTLPAETNIANCLARMAEIPRIVSTAKATLTHPPKTILETAIRQNRGAIAFYEKDLFTLAGETPQRTALERAAAPIAALLRDYQKFLETDLMARATGDWRLGKTKFNRKLELVLDAGLGADDVLAMAHEEFNRVQAEMYVVSRQLWSRYFPGKALPPDDREGRKTTVLKVVDAVGQEHDRPEELLAAAKATVGRIKEFIRAQDILRLPEPDRCQVIEMPEFKRGNSVAYCDNAPPLDPQAETLYAISPPPADWDAQRVATLLAEYNHHMLQVLTIHEAYPGHYVQLAYANRTRSLVRRVLASGVFIEGWAVYGEQTMLDQGYGDGDLRLRLMQLKFYLRAVANAILDHEMHCTPMTDEAALRFLVEDTYQSEGEARLKIIRAKQSSAQLSTYFVGRMAFYRLRQQIEREQGDQFSLGRYHEAVLAHGSVPVKYLPELVRARLKQPR